MPGLSGPEVLKEIDDKCGSKVILISAYSGEYNMEKALSIGADLFIPKPFENVFDVIAKSEELING